MRKILLIGIIVTALFMLRMAQAASVNVTAGSGSGSPGSTNIGIPITVGNLTGEGVISAQIELEYDATRLSFSSLVPGAMTAAWGNPVCNFGIPGRLIIAFYGTTPLTGQGLLTTIYFNVNAQAASGTSDLKLTKVIFNDGLTTIPIMQNGTFTVSSQNRPPVLETIGNKQVAEGSTLIFNILATDLDGDNLVYSARNLPHANSLNPATFNPSTRAFNWTPGYTQAGTYREVHFEVSDGKGGVDSEDITITVTVTNVAETYTLTINSDGGSVTRNPNQASYNEGTQVSLTVVPQSGYSFSSWSGDLTGTTNPASITMNSDKTVIAYFVASAPSNTPAQPRSEPQPIKGESDKIDTSGAAIIYITPQPKETEAQEKAEEKKIQEERPKALLPSTKDTVSDEPSDRYYVRKEASPSRQSSEYYVEENMERPASIKKEPQPLPKAGNFSTPAKGKSAIPEKPIEKLTGPKGETAELAKVNAKIIQSFLLFKVYRVKVSDIHDQPLVYELSQKQKLPFGLAMDRKKGTIYGVVLGKREIELKLKVIFAQKRTKETNHRLLLQ